MKKSLFISALVYAFILISGCGEDSSTESNLKNDGTLSVKMRTWNTYETKTIKSPLTSSSTPIILDFVDMKGYKYQMKVTADEIMEDLKDSDIDYQSAELKEDSARDFQFTLPAGQYKGFALLQSKEFFWIGDYNGKRIEIPASNGGSSDSVYNVFGSDGLYNLNAQNKLEKVDNDELVGVSFTINEDQTTSLTIRANFKPIEWFDKDDNGDWSEGDSLGELSLPDTVKTMSDFIVVYE